MNRLGGQRLVRRLRVPRTRGDEPYLLRSGRKANAEFPAHAGMNREQALARKGSKRVPRTRGDEPENCT